MEDDQTQPNVTPERLLVCCVNIQEGRSASVLRAIADATRHASSAPGNRTARLLRVFIDPVYHRSGLTIAGQPDAVIQAVAAVARTALSLIDLRHVASESSVHNHIGAVDLVPFHPVPGSAATIEDAADATVKCGRLIFEAVDTGHPVLLYGAAHPSGRGLAALRKETSFFRRPGSTISVGPDPDFGPRGAPSAARGVTVCGATPYVLNHNVVLATEDLSVGQSIAKAVRSAEVEAMAFEHAGVYEPGGDLRPIIEVACNLKRSDAPDASPTAIDSEVAVFAAAHGTAVLYSYATNPLPGHIAALIADLSSDTEWTAPPGHPLPTVQ